MALIPKIPSPGKRHLQHLQLRLQAAQGLLAPLFLGLADLQLVAQQGTLVFRSSQSFLDNMS